ncbi:MAG: DUF1553 domain-containing protein [Bryobacterales bacterium]|nr:DUF1553 domain-containing protein [Bryobacterales bacterium]
MQFRLVLLLSGVAIAAGGASPQKPIDFNRDIRPILSDTCFACHGPDEKHRMVGLRLDTKDGAFAERKGGPVIVPGDPAASRLYQRVSAEKKAMRMPPAGAGQDLTAAQIDLLRRWIAQGAKWETHWAYTTPVRPELPTVGEKGWPRNAIDNFVLARLEREGLEPSHEADKATLLRRVTLDLTGLPPTPAEVNAFVADKSSAAYEKVVDRLLASPRHAERMAMQWLDLARYADTHGYHIDSHRDMWPWRDWLIRAFARNMPYDEFTIEQLAGDLLPSPTRDQLIATGFNRNHMINFEGGAIPEEYHVEYVVDRVEATSNVWMGMTLGCARCHDHKYDPVSQKDFYRFFAFFNNVSDKGLDGRYGNAEPFLQLSTPEQKNRLDNLTWQIECKESDLDDEQLAPQIAEWEKQRRAAIAPDSPKDGLVGHWEFDGHLADTSGNYRHATVPRGEVTWAEGPVVRSAVFSGETHASLGGAADFNSGDAFSLALWIRRSGSNFTVLHKSDPGRDHRGFDISFDEFIPVPDLRRASHLSFRLIHKWPGSAIVVRTRERLIQGDWDHIVINYDGSGKAAGVKLFVNGKPYETDVLEDTLAGSFRTSAPLGIGDKHVARPYKGQIDDLRVYNRQLTVEEIDHLAIHYPIDTVLASAKRSKDQKSRVREYFLTYAAPENLRAEYRELNRLLKEKKELEKQIPTTMVMDEGEPRETFVLGRGDYRNRTEKVTADVPSALPPLPKDAPRNRLGLARWLIDPANPLTSRVAVNRYWQMYFGTGLVKTVEDFGSQGEPPSHPELLDWLATEFIRTGWDIRAMQRLIVTSATYRQSSKASPELVEKDPENRLLARMSRFRLPAETVRDNALAISGLLVEKTGGPSVYPYQPEGVWEAIAYGDVYSAQKYKQDHGEALYRRSMYTFWKRTAPPPALATFDAPDREKCTARRARTNTPLQALVLLNDPTFVESSRKLAEHMMADGGKDAQSRIRYGWKLATARNPESREVRPLKALFEQEYANYRNDRDSALKLTGVGESEASAKFDAAELAAWTTVASVILNLDETITKE